MPILPSDIHTIVLKEDDFGHELRVGHILANIEYPASRYEQVFVEPPLHGGTYTDQVTMKTRQFDYRCQIVRGHDRSSNIFLAAECKNLNPDLPLVVCGRPRTDNESYHVFILGGDNGRPSLKKVEGNNSLYRPNDFVGKSILRLKKKDNKLCADGDSEIYDKWTQALASSHDLAFGAVYNNSQLQSYAFVMPLVVVPDNSLWIACYRPDGTIDGDPKQVDKCEYYVDQKVPIGLPFVITHIHFVTLKGLSELLYDFVASDMRAWYTTFSKAASDFRPSA